MASRCSVRPGQSYSAIGGLYRQYELIYIVADERDVLRVRTNFRQGEDVYLYRTLAPPAKARERFLEYVNALNALHTRARWYNAITTIRTQRPTNERMPWDWRILLNGKGDEMMFERGNDFHGRPVFCGPETPRADQRGRPGSGRRGGLFRAHPHRTAWFLKRRIG